MNTTKIVEKILEKEPRAREDDKYLCYLVYQKIAKKEGEVVWIPFNLFKKFPAFETISRIRRKLNEKKPTESFPTKYPSAVSAQNSHLMA